MRSLTFPPIGAPAGVSVVDADDPPDDEDIAYNAEVNRLIIAEIEAARAAGDEPIVAVFFPDDTPDTADVLTLDRDGNLTTLQNRAVA